MVKLILEFLITFKENCPDIRNTKAIDVYKALTDFKMDVDVYDPWASNAEVKHEYGINIIDKIDSKYNAIVHVVSHKEFLNIDLDKLKKETAIVYDVKGSLSLDKINGRL